eukprot:Ihof_evm6s94 gene=Ihof_evmTU6s94
MDSAQLQQTFLATFDPATTKEAEARLNNELCFQPMFVPSLMQLVTTQGIDPTIQQAGAVYLKNHLNHYWANFSTDPQKYLIPDNEKQLVRDNILDMIVAIPAKIKVNMTVVLSRMIANDYPEKMGAEFINKAVAFLGTGDANTVYSGLIAIYELTKRYEHKKVTERQPYYDVVPILFPRLYDIAAHYQSMSNDQASLMLRQVLKIFFSTINYDLPMSMAQDPSFVHWMTLCGSVAVAPVPAEQMDSEDPFHSNAWLAKKRAVAILYQLTSRYGIPTLSTKEYKQFSTYFVAHYAPNIVEMAFNQLIAKSQGAVVSPRLQKLFIKILEAGMNHGKTWAVLKPKLEPLISHIIFPPLCHTVEDEELWQEDPFEYIRMKFDPMTDYVSPAKAADALLLEMVAIRKKTTLMPVLSFCDRTLSAYNQATGEQHNPHHKDGILCIIGLLAETINEKQELNHMLEPMLLTHVVPEFDSPYGFLRARACWMMQHFSQITYSSDHVLVPIVEKLLYCLDSGDLPVQVMAAIGIQSVLCQPAAREVLLPHLSPLLQKIIALTNEAENDDLTQVLQDLVITFGEDMGSEAAMVASQLSDTFLKMMNYDPANDDDTNKAMTAMGILSAIQTLISMFIEKAELLLPVEKAVLPTISAIFTGNQIDFYEEALDMMAMITFAMKAVSPDMWAFFPIVYQSFKTEACDFFNEMMPVFDNYISLGTEVFLSNSDYITAVLDICDAVLTSDIQGEQAHMNACRLIESLLLNCRGHIDAYMPSLIGVLMKRYSMEFSINSTKVLLLEVTAECVYYNAALAFQILESMQVGTTQTFFNMWFENLPYFKRVHDLTVIAGVLCEVLSLPENQLPAAVAAGIPHMVPALIKVMADMPAAIKRRKEMLEDEGEDDEDVNEMDDEDEEDDLDEGDEYLERLAEKAAAAEELEDLEDLTDDEEVDELEEEDIVVETPLDKLNIYILIRDTFNGQRGRSKASFESLVQALSPEQQQKLADGFTKARVEEELR